MTINPSTQPDPAYAQLEESLAAWAAGQEDIRALVLIGSRARTSHPADAWSDLDAILLVDDTRPYRAPGAWQVALRAALGRPAWVESLEFIDDETPDWEMVLEGGLKVDLTFSHNRSPLGRTATLAEISALCPLNFVFSAGARVLADNTPGQEPLNIPHPPEPAPPDQAAFDGRVANLLNELYRATRLAGRGEMWRAARAINEEARGSLLALIEWHAGQPSGGYGRFLETWADPRVLAALPATYADGTPTATRRAIRALLGLLAWLAPEAADRNGLVAPQVMMERTAAWLETQLEWQAYQSAQMD